MSIRLLMSVLIAGVHFPVDGATLSLDPGLEATLVGQGKAEWIARPVIQTNLVEHAAEHRNMGNPLWKCGVPFILFAGDGGSNGLIFNGTGSGAFTLSSAVMASFIPPKFYAYLPADQAYSGSAAGWYYGTMSTVTAGVLYANMYDPTTGVPPAVPTSLTALPVTKLTRLTQTTNEITALQVQVSPIGDAGLITETIKAVGTATAGTKTFQCRIGSASVYSFSWTASSVVIEGMFSVQNSGSETEQIVTRGGSFIGQTGITTLGGNEFKSVDLSSPFLFKNTMQIAANTESFALWFKSVNVT